MYLETMAESLGDRFMHAHQPDRNLASDLDPQQNTRAHAVIPVTLKFLISPGPSSWGCRDVTVRLALMRDDLDKYTRGDVVSGDLGDGGFSDTTLTVSVQGCAMLRGSGLAASAKNLNLLNDRTKST